MLMQTSAVSLKAREHVQTENDQSCSSGASLLMMWEKVWSDLRRKLALKRQSSYPVHICIQVFGFIFTGKIDVSMDVFW